MTDFRTTSVADLAHQVRSRAVSVRELTQAALDRIERLNPTYNAFVAVDGERALADADALDASIASGADPGPLAGVPLAVKDTQDAIGYRTTNGSPVLADAPQAVTDIPFVARMKAAGCIVVGKTNTPEFAWSGNTTNAVFGPTLNPFATDHGPGGSSGGAAAALAAGMVPLATGSDGGGSIRIPSACCGLSGMKPSLGRVPGGGVTPPGWLDLSTNGPMARRIADVTTALEVAVSPDPTDLPRTAPARGQLAGGARRTPCPDQGGLGTDPRVRQRRRRGDGGLRARRVGPRVARGGGLGDRHRLRRGSRQRLGDLDGGLPVADHAALLRPPALA